MGQLSVGGPCYGWMIDKDPANLQLQWNHTEVGVWGCACVHSYIPYMHTRVCVCEYAGGCVCAGGGGGRGVGGGGRDEWVRVLEGVRAYVCDAINRDHANLQL